MDSTGIKRALRRLATEIVETNHGAEDLYIVGVRRRGVPLAERIVEKIEALEFITITTKTRAHASQLFDDAAAVTQGGE